ncbi:hypothetical protein F2Q69_00021049 [Brassica cretica]|uniref:Uncharacterized protein n=1 Tax=Brassica cretica TaxID=69181 RepID=A0A3N6RR34_BRACR|nr:hypothetical protein F2Q69_00021049 [Brassica cretica]
MVDLFNRLQDRENYSSLVVSSAEIGKSPPEWYLQPCFGSYWAVEHEVRLEFD